MTAVSAAVPEDLWAGLLARLEQKTSSLANTLRMASFGGIQQGQAVILFPHHLDTFARQWSSNGKKDQIAQVITDLCGEPTGVKFEIEQPEANVPTGIRTAPPAKSPIDPAAQDDPLVKMVVEEFGGRIVKVE